MFSGLQTKEKDGKERICNRVKQAVFGDSGDTFAVFYVTFTDSGVKSFVKESILTDSLEQEFLWRTMGSSMVSLVLLRICIV